ncbi:MAG: hypothetical protein HC807_02430 [Gammaproteobacteria bacterium]|nr:hypothetical protein [Gammaproteobacteria bacterium]
MSFVFDIDEIALPAGAWSRTRRRMLRWQGRELVGFTQGEFRPYLYPVYTPAGFAVTAEGPADHPHHSSIWIGADHVHARMPVGAAHEEYTYNFYVDHVFQGRAPGRLIEDVIEGTPTAPDRYRVTQRIRWQGPAEWAASEGRTILIETRETLVRPGERYNVIEVRSTSLRVSGTSRLAPRVTRTSTSALPIRFTDGPAAGYETMRAAPPQRRLPAARPNGSTTPARLAGETSPAWRFSRIHGRRAAGGSPPTGASSRPARSDQTQSFYAAARRWRSTHASSFTTVTPRRRRLQSFTRRMPGEMQHEHGDS